MTRAHKKKLTGPADLPSKASISHARCMALRGLVFRNVAQVITCISDKLECQKLRFPWLIIRGLDRGLGIGRLSVEHLRERRTSKQGYRQSFVHQGLEKAGFHIALLSHGVKYGKVDAHCLGFRDLARCRRGRRNLRGCDLDPELKNQRIHLPLIRRRGLPRLR